MASASGPGTGSGECEGEDQDDSSSSDSVDVHEATVAFDALNVQGNSEDKESEDELSAFRQQWQRELEGTPTPQTEYANSQKVAEPETEEEKAKQLFLRGVEYERSGKLYEAIQNYKRAMQILPDVEFRLYESSQLRTDTPEAEAVNEEESNLRKENTSDDDDEDAVEGEDLLQRLQRIVARKGVICEPDTPTKGGHLSWLPYELILLVLRWVVSSDLDATSLERVSTVCRGLYVTARDNDIWRSLCLKTWGAECGVPRSQGFVSWRQMYVERPRIHLHGCYISKTSYLRHGENSFQDAFYRPWYLVDYYRYLRFFSEGTVLMWTTAEEPGACVAQLRQRTARPALGILRGHYRLVGDRVVVVIRKPGADRRPPQPSHTRFRPRKKETFEQHDHIFHMELQLRCVRGRRNWQLSWRTYAVSTRRDHWTHFELCSSKFPPFAFSRVRGYTALADAPL